MIAKICFTVFHVVFFLTQEWNITEDYLIMMQDVSELKTVVAQVNVARVTILRVSFGPSTDSVDEDKITKNMYSGLWCKNIEDDRGLYFANDLQVVGLLR